MAVEPKLMTAAELERLPRDGQRHELVRGELRTMAPPGFEHGDLTAVFGSSLNLYVRTRKLGKVVIGDVGFRLTSDLDTVRAPNVALVRRERVEAAGRVP